jgi:hypothetical protein
LTTSLDGGFDEVDESFRAAANCFSSSAILAGAAASCVSNSATRRADRGQFGHFLRRTFMMRQFARQPGNQVIAIQDPVNGYDSLGIPLKEPNGYWFCRARLSCSARRTGSQSGFVNCLSHRRSRSPLRASVRRAILNIT